MSIPRSNKVLPRRIDPRKMAIQGGSLQGSVPLAEMARLSEIIEGNSGEATAVLNFSRDQQGRCLVVACIAATVCVRCQRCLQAMACELSGNSTLAIIADEEQAEQLPREVDPWIVAQETADLFEMLEEELLLMLPIVNYHDESRCTATTSFGATNIGKKSFESEDRGKKSSQESPFAVLVELKKRQH